MSSASSFNLVSPFANKNLHWIDMHAHLDKLEEGPEQALQKAMAQGVARIVTIGTEPADHPVVLSIAKKYYPKVFCTLGVHPHEGGIYTSEAGEFIAQNLHHPYVIAVGEIGLDYYYKHSDQKSQLEAFEAQLEIAKKHHMPVEIHTRDAEADTVEMLKRFKGDVTGLIHCFTGSAWLAKECLDLGFNISISGVVTFKNASDLRNTVEKIVPLDRLHIETDSPFLAPIPHRGHPNTPAFVVHTAEVVAQLKQVSLEQLCEQTKLNAEKLFPKLVQA